MAKPQTNPYSVTWRDITVPEPFLGQASIKSRRSARSEPALVRWTLMGGALAFLILFLFVPLAAVFAEALKKGWDAYLAAITEPDG
jgi:sulfate/thiosulfate transport system permease protein